ncbi:MAG TPA: family 43 glycosylhydrolase [Candidatus Acidoferrales bacterium]|nr:family 43 glycosylhydrolase [Candidatus Acidoferrales bacterium]
MKNWHVLLVGAVLLAGCGGSAQTSNAVDSATGWVLWTKSVTPAYTGSSRIVSDPSVIADDAVFRLAFTSVDFTNPAGPHASISLATSTDSSRWTAVDSTASGSVFRGEILRGRDGEWDENLETPFLLKTANGYFLYYSGYRDGVDPSEPAKGLPASLGLAASTDGVTFTRAQSAPILEPTPDSFDADAIYSPDVIPYEGGYLMVYAGHCYNHCPGDAPGVRILSATSPDGVHWAKSAQPLLAPSAPPKWMSDGVAEPAILLGPDGYLYLFFTGVNGTEHAIGVARTASLTNAWDIDPKPIIAPTAGSYDETGDTGPSVMLENGAVRMWFTGTTGAGQYSIGYAEAQWPLRRSKTHSTNPVLAIAAALPSSAK